MNDRSAQIADRLPVWMALSELFLDTRLNDNDQEYIAQSLAESPYSIRELEEILSSEVDPILKSNLRSAAGEWAGFDGDWLCEHLSPRIDRKTRFRPLNSMTLPREWHVIKSHIARIRSG